MALGKPAGRMDCVDLGCDFFLMSSSLVGLPKLPIEYYDAEALKAVFYEGISRLCFSCGRVGHCREQCQYTVKPPMAAKLDTDNGSPRDSGIGQGKNPGDNHALGTKDNIHSDHSDKDVYGPWMVVT
ncbi:hypothetical protein SO802_017317 [Lithocarpus litseifolius]|uniref:CCHC-type domain-containing protein n=1 Tax=Lithocarpus litseifolius TaxID=425828 RepID=A0AAW2CZM7_9ROSI